jgi:tetratricopeptide (TPR) repeat protein
MIGNESADETKVPGQGAQYQIGGITWRLGEREGSTARLHDAISAYRDALLERTRERLPLDWAMTQNNLGNALWKIGERESGTARLEEAVNAFRNALEEWTQERTSYYYSIVQRNIKMTLEMLRKRRA